MEHELIVMKRSYKEPKTGDIFVVKPREHVFYYGKVIESQIKSKYLGFSGWHLIFIYDIWTKEKNPNINLEGIPLLIPPMVVNKRPWTMGYFETVKKAIVTDYDLSIDFGFWDSLRKKYFDIRGNEMSRKPKYFDEYGLSSFGAVGKEIHKALSVKRLIA